MPGSGARSRSLAPLAHRALEARRVPGALGFGMTTSNFSTVPRRCRRWGRGTAARKGRTPTTTIRLDPEEIARARAQAAQHGLRYQTYLKMLLHQALGEAEDGVKGRRS